MLRKNKLKKNKGNKNKRKGDDGGELNGVVRQQQQ